MRLRLIPDHPDLGWTPFAWLVYLGIYLVYPVFGGASALEWAIYAVALVVFLALYFRAFWVGGRELLPYVAAIVALGVLLSPMNPGATVFFIYGAAFMGEVGRPSVAIRGIAAIVVIVAIESLIFSFRPSTWIPPVVFSVIIGGTNLHFAERRRADARLRLAQHEVERLAKVAERERIARDLHDLLGHTLSIIVLKSELASKLADRDHQRAIEEIRDVERISRHALSEVRRAVEGYRVQGLAAELATARAALGAAGVSVESAVPDLTLGPAEEKALAFALREAVTNVIRHAQARRCWISLREAGGAAELEIRDDGVGIGGTEGSGLAGMRDRLRALGGRLAVENRSGTRLRMTVPIKVLPAGDAAADGTA
jgi:two-component system sensor histidine kinase DesK